MALIQCPECGKMVSDKAGICPGCGCPIVPTRPMQPAGGGYTQQQPSSGISLTSMSCPDCGGALELVSKDLARCPLCGKTAYLSGVNMDDTAESILTFQITKDDFHRKCMKYLMDIGEEDVFSQIGNIKVRQYYIWVRQFGHGGKQDFYPMDAFGESLFKMITGKDATLPYEKFNEIFPKDSFRTFQTRYVEEVEVKNRDFSPATVVQKYMSLPKTNGYQAQPFYYCLPIFEESFEYKGKTYHFYGDGTEKGSWFAFNDVPKSKHIEKGPKYIHFYPLMTAVITLMGLAALIFVGTYVFAAFSGGFWSGVFTLVLTGIVLAFTWWIIAVVVGVVGTVVSAVFGLIDLPIRAAINTKRRTKYRAEYERIQKRKQEEARVSIGLELPYVVPECPIP